VVEGVGLDKRIGRAFLNAGIGFGGSCFPKDVKAFVKIAEKSGYDFALLKGVIEVNDEQARRIVAKVREAVGGTLDGTVVALWGLAFKAGTDDTRDSPSLRLAEYLRAEGARVRAYDPHVRSVPELEMAADALDATKAADVLLIATEWGEFQNVDLGEVRDAMRGDAIVDARNLLDPGAVRRLGLRYSGVGR